MGSGFGASPGWGTPTSTIFHDTKKHSSRPKDRFSCRNIEPIDRNMQITSLLWETIWRRKGPEQNLEFATPFQQAVCWKPHRSIAIKQIYLHASVQLIKAYCPYAPMLWFSSSFVRLLGALLWATGKTIYLRFLPKQKRLKILSF